MAENKNGMNQELENRLEYLFSDDNGSAEEDEAASPLMGLKAVFLAIEWEINDEIMEDLLQQVDLLKETFKDDQILLLFLQLLAAVGKYIKSEKARSHPDSIKLLNSIYTSLGIVSMSRGLTEAERKKILRTEVNRFKKLKEEVARKRDKAPPPPQAEAAPEPEASPLDRIPDAAVREALVYMLEELKAVVKSEISALRDDLKP